MKFRYQWFWLISTLSYLMNNEKLSTVLFVIIIVLMLRNLGNEIFFIENLPYAIVLSPALFVIKISSFNLVFSDIFIFLGGVFLILSNLKNRKPFTYNAKSSLLVSFFISIFIFNLLQIIIFSVIDEYTDYKFLIYILFHLILFFALLATNMSCKQQQLLLKGFLKSVSFAVIIILTYYSRGESLLAWSGGEFAKASDLPEHLFFRATYFYSGFFLYLGCSIAVLVYLLFHNSILFPTRLLIGIVLVAEVIAALAFINKTVFVALAMTLVLMQFYKLRYNGWKFLQSLIVKASFVLGVLWTFIIFLDFSRFKDFIGYSTQTGSLAIRFFIYQNSIKLLFTDLFHLLFGEGLGFLSSDEPKSLLYKTNEYGQTEGTIDSQFMNIIIETGLVGWSLILCFVVAVLYRIYGLQKQDKNFAVPVVIMFAIIAITSLTQRMGMAKLSLILPVLTVLLAKYRTFKI